MTKPAGTHVLEISDLTVEVATDHGWLPVVDSVDLSVARNEIVGLVGESGSGKTVTSLAAMGLLPPSARIQRGAIAVVGKDIVGAPERELSRMRGRSAAMIFQEPRRSLNPAFTVGEQVAESIRRHTGSSRRRAWQRTIELFELVEIADARRRSGQYPHEFSGGMCQRVMLAMALACDPELLIADEPTTALDVTVQRQVLELIKRIQTGRGLGVLLITHDQGVVAEMCDRVNVMYAGQVVEHADVDSIFHAPRHPYTAALLRSMLNRTKRGEPLAHIDGLVPPPHLLPTGCRFAERCDFAEPGRCSEPVKLVPFVPGHTARCIRAAELTLEGVKA